MERRRVQKSQISLLLGGKVSWGEMSWSLRFNKSSVIISHNSSQKHTYYHSTLVTCVFVKVTQRSFSPSDNLRKTGFHLQNQNLHSYHSPKSMCTEVI